MGVFGSAPMAGVLAVPQTSSFMGLGRHFQPFGTPQPLHPLAVDEPMLRLKLGGDAPVAKAGVQPGEFMETLDQFSVVRRTLKLILLRAPGLAECPARSPFTDAQRPPDVADNVPAGTGR